MFSVQYTTCSNKFALGIRDFERLCHCLKSCVGKKAPLMICDVTFYQSYQIKAHLLAQERRHYLYLAGWYRRTVGQRIGVCLQ